MSGVRVEFPENEKVAVELKIGKHIQENARKIAQLIAKEAKSSTSFKDQSGNLRKSIKAKKSRFEDGGYIVKAGGKGARQAHLVEFGYGGPKPAPPKPFLRPALDKNINAAKEIFGVRQ